MLHLDVWWQGKNLLVDGGSYLYNGPKEWHNHFMRTASHNTLTVDRRDQMEHVRRFKYLYWTEANLLHFADEGDWVLCEGEHYGYQRHSGKGVHRRSVLFVKDDLWVVVDTILGNGTHAIGLNWQGGDFPYEPGEGGSQLILATPSGKFSVTVLDESGNPLSGDVVAGQEAPPRGWLSRYYGEKVAAPSFAIEHMGQLPFIFVSILGAGKPEVKVTEGHWSVTAGHNHAAFRIDDGRLRVALAGTPVQDPALSVF
jgi:asparagine synthase (glutamine-hydrolysing)